MTKKLFLVTILTLSLVITGCSSNSATKPSDNNNDTNIVEKSQNSNNSTQEKPKEDKQKSEKAEQKSEQQKVDKVKLSIYNEDANTMEMKEVSTIEVNEASSLEDKLKQLANALSEKTFDKLPIEVKSIDTVNGKKVAIINLKDSENSKWSSKFQGSTGGQITSDTLLETFLQVKYKNEWIDGVKFLYNNQPIEYEHAENLSQINYRN